MSYEIDPKPRFKIKLVFRDIVTQCPCYFNSKCFFVYSMLWMTMVSLTVICVLPNYQLYIALFPNSQFTEKPMFSNTSALRICCVVFPPQFKKSSKTKNKIYNSFENVMRVRTFHPAKCLGVSYLSSMAGKQQSAASWIWRPTNYIDYMDATIIVTS